MNPSYVSDFISFLVEGLAVCMHALTHIEFMIEGAVFNTLDMITYSAIIGSTLAFISSRYKGEWRGNHKQINRKVD